jgi:tetratricopeptide (TPR) repeat protein
LLEDPSRRLLSQAGSALAAGRYDVALPVYEAILASNPGHELARFGQATCLHALGRLADAARLFGELADRHPANAGYRYNQGYSLLVDARYTEAARVLDECARRVDDPHVRANLALALMNAPVRELDRARTLLAEAAARLPDDPAVQLNLAHLLLLTGDYAAGMRQHERRPIRGQPGVPEDCTPWRGEPLGGRTLFVWPEQGFGDSLHFARYLIPLASRAKSERATVLFRPLPALGRLFAHSFASLTPDVHVIDAGEEPRQAQLHCSLVSLPERLHESVAGIPDFVPYVHAEPALVAHWRGRTQSLRGLKVGLVWSAATHDSIDPVSRQAYLRRNLALAQLRPLLDVGGVTFVSLQKGQPAAEAGAMTGRDNFIDWTDALTDFAETAALIANLDLVVTVDTAVCHLAGAMGQDVWLMNRRDADWRWELDRDESTWYPTL